MYTNFPTKFIQQTLNVHLTTLIKTSQRNTRINCTYTIKVYVCAFVATDEALISRQLPLMQAHLMKRAPHLYGRAPHSCETLTNIIVTGTQYFTRKTHFLFIDLCPIFKRAHPQHHTR